MQVAANRNVARVYIASCTVPTHAQTGFDQQRGSVRRLHSTWTRTARTDVGAEMPTEETAPEWDHEPSWRKPL